MTDKDTEHPHAEEDIVEIYAAGSDVEANRIVLLLGDEGIECQHRETSIPMYPGATGRFLVTVFASDVTRAKKLIEQAIADEVLPRDGTFL